MKVVIVRNPTDFTAGKEEEIDAIYIKTEGEAQFLIKKLPDGRVLMESFDEHLCVIPVDDGTFEIRLIED